jgi:hypothetical protein
MRGLSGRSHDLVRSVGRTGVIAHGEPRMAAAHGKARRSP